MTDSPTEAPIAPSAQPILSDTAPRLARVLQVLRPPARGLMLRAAPVPSVEGSKGRELVIDAETRALIDDMIATLDHHQGIGLAAPQVGVSKRVILARTIFTAHALVVINPVVSNPIGSAKELEGCLSLPTKSVKVKRATQITVEGFNRDGAPIRFVASGRQARVIQHEVDHLNGVMMTARAS